MRFSQHGRQTYRTEGHATAINRCGNNNIGSSIVSLVQGNFRGDFRFVNLGNARGEFESELVEAAPGVTDVVFKVFPFRRITGFRHDPGARNHIGSPSVIAQCFIHGIERDAQSAARTFCNTIEIVIFTFKTDALVIYGNFHLIVTFKPFMNSVGT